MKQPTVFEFTSYSYEPAKRRVVFNYKTHFAGKDAIVWTEIITLPAAPKNQIPKKLLESLHLILGISYYKFYLGEVKLPYKSSKEEADFWSTVYKKGLGEFFYKNNLDPKVSPKFPSASSLRGTSKQSRLLHFVRNDEKCLVGIGGGKDSIVSAELLKQNGFAFDSFAIETNKESPLIKNIAKIIGKPHLKIQRTLDEKVFKQHRYNGHIPISAMYAFLGIFMCIAYGYKYFIVSNEYSSNFGNVKYKGLDVNHQWSKSFEFETLFQNYIKKFISPDVGYFSLLRPFSELRIVKLFSKYKKYFPYFSSCNRNFTFKGIDSGGLWCKKCAKCVFAFTLLSAYLPKKELLEIFGKNLYEDEGLLPLFKDILGLGVMKPFDCVGTFEEAQTALSLAKDKAVLSHAEGLLLHIAKRIKFHSETLKTQKENAIPHEFKFLGMENALILGYGKEGKVTEKYLKKYYPKLKIGVGDETRDKSYLKKQNDFDIAIKTPGIKKELVTIPYTTATNIFFSKVKGNPSTPLRARNLIIGVTGSKGKSTTSSLIYHILKTAKKDVEFLGNIGRPMLERLLKPISKSAIFVLELSSYQLDDIAYSPDIAVITSLFPEHMDFHGNLQNYYNAKRNIFLFQTKGEHLIDRPKAKKRYKTNLLGEHNQNNIEAAVQVAKILKIPEAAIRKSVATFQPLEHRLEPVGKYKDIIFYNDANAATPEATIGAIKALKNVDTIFLGGQDRGYNFTQLEKVIRKHKIKNVVLFPDSGGTILKIHKGLNVLKTKSMADAVKFAYQHTQKGNICLLSCASPSYSLWKNFEVKGDEFKKFVKKFGEKN